MATWYLNQSLTNFRAAVDAAYPGRDKASDGTIGDEDHQATTSDHNPDLAGEPDAGSVDAWDMDVHLLGPALPPPADHIEALKRTFQAHEASRYWIHNRQIARRSSGWVREVYTGSNPHTGHVHWNSREPQESSTAAWFITGGDMTPEQYATLVNLKAMMDAFTQGRATWTTTGGSVIGIILAATKAEVLALQAVIEQLVALLETGGGSADTAAILAGVDALLEPIRVAIAALPNPSQVHDQTEAAVRKVLGAVDE